MWVRPDGENAFRETPTVPVYSSCIQRSEAVETAWRSKSLGCIRSSCKLDPKGCLAAYGKKELCRILVLKVRATGAARKNFREKFMLSQLEILEIIAPKSKIGILCIQGS